jgi:hypothetical protein
MKFVICFYVIFHVKMSMISFSGLHSSHMHCIFHIYFGMFNLVMISFEISQIKHFYFFMYKNKHNESLCTSMIDFTIIVIKSHLILVLLQQKQFVETGCSHPLIT